MHEQGSTGSALGKDRADNTGDRLCNGFFFGLADLESLSNINFSRATVII